MAPLGRLAAKHDLINLLEFEPGNLDRRAGQDQFLELDLELIEVPLALFAQTINGKTQQALLVVGQMVDSQQGA
jgi:hypothetical protein